MHCAKCTTVLLPAQGPSGECGMETVVVVFVLEFNVFCFSMKASETRIRGWLIVKWVDKSV